MAKRVSDEEDVVSLATADMTSGGLIDDVDVKVTAAEWTRWESDNEKFGDRAALFLTVTVEETDAEEVIKLGAGSIDKLVPSDDGERLLRAPGSSAKGLNSGSNAGVFLTSLEGAGFPTERISKDGASVLVGLRFHLIRVAPPKGRQAVVAEDGRERTPAGLVTVGEILTLPWEKKGGKTAAKATGEKGKAAKDEDEDSDSDSDIVESVAEVVKLAIKKNKGAAIPLNKLRMECFRAGKDLPVKDKKAVVDWLEENEEDLSGLEEHGLSIDADEETIGLEE